MQASRRWWTPSPTSCCARGRRKQAASEPEAASVRLVAIIDAGLADAQVVADEAAHLCLAAGAVAHGIAGDVHAVGACYPGQVLVLAVGRGEELSLHHLIAPFALDAGGSCARHRGHEY